MRDKVKQNKKTNRNQSLHTIYKKLYLEKLFVKIIIKLMKYIL